MTLTSLFWALKALWTFHSREVRYMFRLTCTLENRLWFGALPSVRIWTGRFPKISRAKAGVGNKSQNPRDPGDFRDSDCYLEFIFKIWDLGLILKIWDRDWIWKSGIWDWDCFLKSGIGDRDWFWKSGIGIWDWFWKSGIGIWNLFSKSGIWD